MTTAAAGPASFDVTVDAVLFDMDGTLVDSTDSIVRCWVEWAGEFDVALDTLRGVWAHGRPARDIVADLIEADRVPAGTARITELEITNTEGVKVLPGAAEALAAVADRAAIVTSCSLDLAVARITAAGLTPPAILVTADDVSRGKPDPEPYLLATQRFGADPSRCLVVEDAPAGLISAAAAGCLRIAVTTTHEPDQLEADLVVSDLTALHWEQSQAGVRVLGP